MYTPLFQAYDKSDLGEIIAQDLAMALRELRVGVSDTELQRFFDLKGLSQEDRIVIAVFMEVLRLEPQFSHALKHLRYLNHSHQQSQQPVVSIDFAYSV